MVHRQGPGGGSPGGAGREAAPSPSPSPSPSGTPGPQGGNLGPSLGCQGSFTPEKRRSRPRAAGKARRGDPSGGTPSVRPWSQRGWRRAGS